MIILRFDLQPQFKYMNYFIYNSHHFTPHGRYILAEIIIDNTKIILVNVYSPNEINQQVVFLRELSKNLLSKYDNENLVLGGRL